MSKKIGFIGRGTFYKEIHRHLKENGVDSLLLNDRPRFAHTRDVIVNYGLSGDKLQAWYSEAHGRAQIKNNRVFGDKLQCCEAVMATGIPVPECCSPCIVDTGVEGWMGEGWIVKPRLSFGGRGIVPHTGQRLTAQQYLQKRVTNRRYELRVHAVKWLPVEEWLVAKRTHPDGEAQLTWNHHQGGSFSTIEMNESNTGVFKRAKQYAKKVMETLGYDFSAVDFIVQNNIGGMTDGPLPVWFIEANLAPGFSTDSTKEFYFKAFMKLAQENSPAVSIPPSVPVQETQRQPAPSPLSLDQKILISAQLLRQRSLTGAELIEFINTLR